MELNHLRAFFEVAKQASFTEAARKLHISQSALSRSVRLLEESEGVRLFERSKKGVKLTPVGQEVFRRSQELFRTFGEIESLVRGTNEEVAGPLRFAASDHALNDLLIEPVQKFREKYPRVLPSIVTGPPDDIIRALNTTETEFGLLFSKVVLPQIEYEAIKPTITALVCSPALWQKCRSSSTSKTLKKVIETAGYISSIGASLQTAPSRVLQELFGELPRIGLETNGQETQKRFAMAGMGVAYLARFMVEKEIRAGTLYEIPIENPHPFNLWMAKRRDRELSLVARTFVEHLRAEDVKT